MISRQGDRRQIIDGRPQLSAIEAGLIARVTKLEQERDELVAALRAAKIGHDYCEDGWYSCPKAPEGCADERQGDDCNCGADRHNAAIDALLAKYPQPVPGRDPAQLAIVPNGRTSASEPS